MTNGATMKSRALTTLIAAVVVPAALLAGCKEEEQNRVLTYQPGVYLGKPDTPLDADQLRRIRSRTAGQAGATALSGGGGGGSTGGTSSTTVRPPVSAPIGAGVLARRGRLQGG